MYKRTLFSWLNHLKCNEKPQKLVTMQPVSVMIQKRKASICKSKMPPSYREYLYFVDHQGMLFLDDAKIKNFTSCYKDKKFLAFFWKRLRVNHTDRHPNFPYLSMCGREFNFVRCDDLPVVYTHLSEAALDSGEEHLNLCYGYVGDELKFPFVPTDLYMSPINGRLYHPGPDYLGQIGLVRSLLAIELSKYFRFQNEDSQSPTHIFWDKKLHELSNKLAKHPHFEIGSDLK